MQKYEEAPLPAQYMERQVTQGETCRWCGALMCLVGGLLMCPHCDTPITSHPFPCLGCAVASGRIDRRGYMK